MRNREWKNILISHPLIIPRYFHVAIFVFVECKEVSIVAFERIRLSSLANHFHGYTSSDSKFILLKIQKKKKGKNKGNY